MGGAIGTRHHPSAILKNIGKPKVGCQVTEGLQTRLCLVHGSVGKQDSVLCPSPFGDKAKELTVENVFLQPPYLPGS
jgi:hypothetical protein